MLNLVGLPGIVQGDEYVHDGGCRPGHSSAPQIPKLYRLALSSANASHSLHAIALGIHPDAQQAVSSTGAVLPWRQPQGGCEILPSAEGLAIAQRAFVAGRVDASAH
ncbi:hypothetical protein [Azotobacter chroococcum]|uniref:hypothetical protein n=1 Tax=Azotobacter chroococcum TaxID=353 RepID=UPI003D334CE9